MQPGKKSLIWHNYSDHLKSMMKELMMNEDFSDVTLVSEDKKQIKANINILSACSPVFKDILKKDKNSNPIIYLRGIEYSELESIMQFIYLGEATFYEERMNEFLAVAKSLEIKELCKAGTVSKDEPDDYPSQSNEPESNEYPFPTDQDTSTKLIEKQNVIPDNIRKEAPQIRRGSVVRVVGKFECDQCHKTYSEKFSLRRHIMSEHEGINYACNQCDYQATKQYCLTVHIQSVHEGVKYACDQCDYQATTQSHLTRHIQLKHEGIKYACDQCDYKATQKFNLTKHIRSEHDGENISYKRIK